MVSSSSLNLGEDGDGIVDVVDEVVPPGETYLGGQSGGLQKKI